MSQSKTGTQLRKAKKFSNYRCVKCHSYLVPLTEEKMDLFDFSSEQKEKVRQHGLTHFCSRCMKGYQRTEQPLSEETENCPYCGKELSFVKYRGKTIPVLWCKNCEEALIPETKEGLKKIQKYAEKTKTPLSKEVLSKRVKEALEEIEEE